MKKLMFILILCFPLLSFAITDEERQAYIENNIAISNIETFSSSMGYDVITCDFQNTGNLTISVIEYIAYLLDQNRHPSMEQECSIFFNTNDYLKPNYSIQQRCWTNNRHCPTCYFDEPGFAIIEIINIWFEGEIIEE